MRRSAHVTEGDGDAGRRPYVIRPFASSRDYRKCVELQEETWGAGFSERVSPAILQVSQILGGVAAGAYDESGELMGFVFGMTGLRGGTVVHWSDMLAVRRSARDGGLGRRLKEYQRSELLDRGIDTMYWTFDPLQSRNAHLNITRLGAVVREYRINMYGQSDSPLHRGIGTDRFVALWLMESQRVRRRLEGASPTPRPDAPSALDAGTVADGDLPAPGSPDLSLGTDAIRVSIPTEVGSLMRRDMALAVAWREATRAVFAHYLPDRYEVTGFERGEPASTYVLTRRRQHA